MRALRLTFGLLTVIPVGAIGDVDRHLARKAILLAPLVGLVLGALAALVVAVVHALVPSTLGALLAAVLAVALLLHWFGVCGCGYGVQDGRVGLNEEGRRGGAVQRDG